MAQNRPRLIFHCSRAMLRVRRQRRRRRRRPAARALVGSPPRLAFRSRPATRSERIPSSRRFLPGARSAESSGNGSRCTALPGREAPRSSRGARPRGHQSPFRNPLVAILTRDIRIPSSSGRSASLVSHSPFRICSPRAAWPFSSSGRHELPCHCHRAISSIPPMRQGKGQPGAYFARVEDKVPHGGRFALKRLHDHKYVLPNTSFVSRMHSGRRLSESAHPNLAKVYELILDATGHLPSGWSWSRRASTSYAT